MTSRDRSSRILVVDDEKVVREVIRNLLDRPGLYLVDAEDGEIAIGLLLQEHFDLLICDKNLPGITGLDVIRRAKTVDRHIGTLLITAYASRESAEESMAIGIDDYIVKPFELADLERKVEEALERRFQRLEVQAPVSTKYSFVRRSPGPKTPGLRVLVCEPDDPTAKTLAEALRLLGHSPVLMVKVADVLEALRTKEADVLICSLILLNRDNAASCFLRSTLIVNPELKFVAVAHERGLEGAVQAVHHGAQLVLYGPLTDSRTVAESLCGFLKMDKAEGLPS